MLLDLIRHNEEIGIYCGNREQWQARRERLFQKIKDAVFT